MEIEKTRMDRLDVSRRLKERLELLLRSLVKKVSPAYLCKGHESILKSAVGAHGMSGSRVAHDALKLVHDLPGGPYDPVSVPYRDRAALELAVEVVNNQESSRHQYYPCSLSKLLFLLKSLDFSELSRLLLVDIPSLQVLLCSYSVLFVNLFFLLVNCCNLLVKLRPHFF